MTEQEVRRYLRQMKEEDSERAFHSFYNLCYDRLFRIACYFVKHEEWAQEIVLDVFMKLWEQRARLPEVNNIEDYCFILTKNASLNYLEKENRHPTLSSEQLCFSSRRRMNTSRQRSGRRSSALTYRANSSSLIRVSSGESAWPESSGSCSDESVGCRFSFSR